MNTTITPLESALIAIRAHDTSKVVHLGPRQARQLCEYIDDLETGTAVLQSIVHDCDERERLQMAVMKRLKESRSARKEPDIMRVMHNRLYDQLEEMKSLIKNNALEPTPWGMNK